MQNISRTRTYTSPLWVLFMQLRWQPLLTRVQCITTRTVLSRTHDWWKAIATNQCLKIFGQILIEHKLFESDDFLQEADTWCVLIGQRGGEYRQRVAVQPQPQKHGCQADGLVGHWVRPEITVSCMCENV